MEHFKDLLKTNNLKSTHQRLAILEAIERFGHIDMDRLYEEMMQKHPTMSKATLYRNINDLIAYHILEEVKLPQHKQHYEIKKIPHIHLLCSECQSVEDVFVETKALLEQIASHRGFKIYNSFMVMNGVCQTCQKSVSSLHVKLN